MIYLEKDLSDSTVEDNSGDSMVEGREMFTSVMVILSGRDKGLNSRVNRVTREEDILKVLIQSTGPGWKGDIKWEKKSLENKG